MAEDLHLVTDLALIFISAGIITLIFRWLKQPLILGYLVAGFIVGPNFDLFPGITSEAVVKEWSEIGIIFLLFTLGLEFSFKKLFKVGSSALITAGTIFMGMFALGITIAHSIGWTSMEGVFLGGMLSMSSTTIIIKAFDDLGLKKRAFTSVVFGTLIIEDLIAILLMVLLSTYAVSQQFAGLDMMYNIFKLFFFLILWFLVGIFIIPSLLKLSHEILNEEMLLILSIGLCFGMVVLANYVGFSSALGAFVMGSIISETIEGERVARTIKGVKDLFGAIFFVSVGMMVDPNIIIEYWQPILILIFVVIFGISFFATAGVLLSGKSIRMAIHSGLSMAQIGEFAFIIAGLGVSLGVMRAHIFPMIIAVSVITTFTTPYLMKLADPFANWLYHILPKKLIERLDSLSTSNNQPNMTKSEWKSLFKLYSMRVLLYSVLLVSVSILCSSYLIPYIQESLPYMDELFIKFLNVVISLLLMAPFLYGLAINNGNCQHSFQSLWEEKRSNRATLLAMVLFRSLLAIFFIVSVFLKYFDLSYWALIFVVLGLAILIMVSRRTLSHYGFLERRFYDNFNQIEDLHKKLAPVSSSITSKLAGKNLHTELITVSPYSDFAGMKLSDVPFRRVYGVNIVKIKRANKSINIPSGDEVIFPHDKILIVGSDEQIKNFTDVMEVDAQQGLPEVEEKIEVLSYQIKENSYLKNMPIKKAKLRESGCMILGVERNGVSYMNPTPDFIFQEEDLVWMVGERGACEWYI